MEDETGAAVEGEIALLKLGYLGVIGGINWKGFVNLYTVYAPFFT